MKKKVFLAMAVILLVLSVGCKPAAKDERRENFRTGSQGLYINIVPNLPPVRVYDDQKLDVMVEIENRGAATVSGPGNKIYLSGFDPAIITGIPTTGIKIDKIEGKTRYGRGGFDAVAFKGTLRALAPKNIDSYRARLLVTACYGYETIAATTICIDPDPYSATAKEKVCTPANAGFGGGQGAPVAVTALRIEPSPGRARFEIDIANVGSGEVFREGGDYLAKCSPYNSKGLAYDEAGYVRLDDITVSERSIKSSCKPLDGDHIRLQNGKGTIYCELNEIRNIPAYTTPITVQLSYGYRNSVFRDITVMPS